jgi:hypothetical protein
MPGCVTSLLGERTRPRVLGSAPPLNPLWGVSDEGVANNTRGRVCSPKIVTSRYYLIRRQIV